MGTEPEETIIDRGDVKITTKRAIIRGTTYPIASLSAVRVDAIPPSVGILFFFGAGAAVFATALIAGALNSASGLADLNWALLIGGVLLAGLTFLCWWVFFTAKPSYVVRLHTAGLQSDALLSPTRELPDAICAALNDAIVRRA